jgi:hypothetical protein
VLSAVELPLVGEPVADVAPVAVVPLVTCSVSGPLVSPHATIVVTVKPTAGARMDAMNRWFMATPVSKTKKVVARSSRASEAD